MYIFLEMLTIEVYIEARIHVSETCVQ